MDLIANKERKFLGLLAATGNIKAIVIQGVDTT